MQARKPEAEHKPSTLTNLHPQTLPKPLSTRSLVPFNPKPETQKLKLNPNPKTPQPPHRGNHGPWAGKGGGTFCAYGLPESTEACPLLQFWLR